MGAESGQSKDRLFYFLSSEEVRFFRSFCSLMVPSGKDSKTEPGANEVGSINYIDSTLYDFPKPVQDYFRNSVDLVNRTSKISFSTDFAGLKDSDKNVVLRELFLDPRTRERIFDLRSLALESFYSDYHDPDYAGITPWELMKFGGKRISGIKKDWRFLKIWKDYYDMKKMSG